MYRHALDIREHYERKLERANNLYMELSAIMLQLEVREKELIKYVTYMSAQCHVWGIIYYNKDGKDCDPFFCLNNGLFLQLH